MGAIGLHLRHVMQQMGVQGPLAIPAYHHNTGLPLLGLLRIQPIHVAATQFATQLGVLTGNLRGLGIIVVEPRKLELASPAVNLLKDELASCLIQEDWPE